MTRHCLAALAAVVLLSGCGSGDQAGMDRPEERETTVAALQAAQGRITVLSAEYAALDQQEDDDEEIEDRLAELEETIAALLDRVAMLEEKLGIERPVRNAPDPDPTFGERTRATLQGLIDASDTIMDASGGAGAEFFWSATVQPTPAALAIEDIRAEGGEFKNAGARRGVSSAIARWEVSWPIQARYTSWGGWLDHSFVLVHGRKTTYDEGPLRPDLVLVGSSTYSVGAASGDNPVSGSATWLGVMAGIDENEDAATFGDFLTGDARLTIDDFASSAIDIAFTNIRNAAGSRYANLTWENMALTNGAFADDVDDVTGESLADPFVVELTGRQPPPGALTPGQISGRFYGPNHEEVGGIFWRDHISGAFAAKRK